jgi:flagellar hook-length control protein FliK
MADVVNAPRETTGKMSLSADLGDESSVALQPPALPMVGGLAERGPSPGSPRESDTTSFVTQLQAAVAFSEPVAPEVTARLSAARTEDGSRMTIELDPAELGPVEVALRLDDSGSAAATFVAERSETLQLLQRDTRALVDLLSGAGFTLDPAKLEFQLRDGQQEPQQQRQQGFGGEPARPGRDDQPLSNNSASVALGRGLLDLRV